MGLKAAKVLAMIPIVLQAFISYGNHLPFKWAIQMYGHVDHVIYIHMYKNIYFCFYHFRHFLIV